jgi:Holliday junction resolvasome RuvABC endonuclease subunit
MIYSKHSVSSDIDIFMGIDQSLSNTGITILKKEINIVKILDSFSINTKNEGPVEERIYFIVNKIEEYIYKYKVGFVCIEDLAFNSNTNSSKILAGLFFSILNMFIRNNVSYRVVNIKTLKKFATGYGNASKEDMFCSLGKDLQNKLFEFSKIKNKKRFEDIVDSYFLSLYGLSLF